MLITAGVEDYSKVIQELLKALEQVNKIYEKFVETRILKKPESIKYQWRLRNKIEKKNHHRRSYCWSKTY